MPQRLQAVDFNYTERRPWEKYLRYRIERAGQLAVGLKRFRNELVERCDGRSFDELQADWEYSRILLGGVDEDGTYRENGLATVYRDLFGVRLESVEDVLEKRRQGISPSTTVVVEETAFTRFLDEFTERVRRSLEYGEENELVRDIELDEYHDFFELLSDAENLTDILSEFLEKLQELLPNHDKRALFVWTLPGVTYRYLSVAYPRLKDQDQERWSRLTELFGLERMFQPDIEEDGPKVEQRERQYSVYWYSEGSLGEELCELYRLVWDDFDGAAGDVLATVVEELPNPKRSFITESEEALSDIDWKIPDDFIVVGENERYSGRRGDTTQSCYHVSGMTLDKREYVEYSTSGNRASGTEECSLSLFEVLDGVSPATFLLYPMKYELRIDAAEGILEVEQR